jgi:hypothetical protein
MIDERDYAITVTRAGNGYVCEWWEEADTGVFFKKIHVVEEGDDDDLRAMRDLLYFIKEHFGVYNSKHNPKNLIIEVK